MCPLNGFACSPAGGIRRVLGATVALIAPGIGRRCGEVAKERCRVVTGRLLHYKRSERVTGDGSFDRQLQKKGMWCVGC